MDATAIIPTLRYANASAAIHWLGSAFGFTEELVIRGEGDTIVHAQLTLGRAMIMLGTAREDDYGRLVSTPKRCGGKNTQAPYVVVPDIDAHYDRAVAAGATIEMPLKEEDHGGKAYTCRDPEGHVWNFGSYDPWQESGGDR